jgi:hypothetical protein
MEPPDRVPIEPERHPELSIPAQVCFAKGAKTQMIWPQVSHAMGRLM